MYHNFNEEEFKSLNNSKRVNGLNWKILSLKITSKPIEFKFGCKMCVCREIAYLNSNNEIYQIGRLYIPISKLRYFLFFLKLLTSGITFGHFVVKNFKNQYKIKLIEFDAVLNVRSVLSTELQICRSKRIVNILDGKYVFYLEEDISCTK